MHHIQQSEVDSLHRYKINLTNRKQLTNGEKKNVIMAQRQSLDSFNIQIGKPLF